MFVILTVMLSTWQVAPVVHPPPPPPPAVRRPPPPPPPAVRRPPPPPPPRPPPPPPAKPRAVVPLPAVEPPIATPSPPVPVRPDPRPLGGGVGLSLGAGAALTTSIGLQVVAHMLVRRRCLDPLVSSENPGIDRAAIARCVADEPGLVAASVGGGLGMLASVGLAGGAGWARGGSASRSDRTPRRGARAVGAIFVALGLSTIITSTAQFGECATSQCHSDMRIVDLVVRNAGALLVAGGTGMLTHDRRLRGSRTSRVKMNLEVKPTMVGVSMTARF